MAATILISSLVLLLLLMAGSATAQSYGGDRGNRYEYNHDQFQNYRMLPKIRATGQERGLCFGKYSPCQMRILRCPMECPTRNPSSSTEGAKTMKACKMDCLKCEATCRDRKPKCEGYGAVCYDPRFVGGDGVLFYFHGVRGHHYALVSDAAVQINARLIGTRPAGRSRDFTWVQSLAVLLPGTPASPALSVAVGAERTAAWDASGDHLYLVADGATVAVPPLGDHPWTEPSGRVWVERTDAANAADVHVAGVGRISVRVVPVDERDDRLHGYGVPRDDCLAHLQMQFHFAPGALSDRVDGLLGQTYRPGFVSPVKRGVPMPVMGGEDRFSVSSLFSADCRQCVFGKNGTDDDAAGVVVRGHRSFGDLRCGSVASTGGILCRR